MIAPFFTQADLERAAGGAAVIVELLDKDKDGVADSDHVEAVIEAGSSEIASDRKSTRLNSSHI